MQASHPSNATTRSALKRQFVDQAGWEQAEIVPLAGDASFRSYDRVHLNGEQAVLMDAPPDKEDVRPFVKIAEFLTESGLSSPEILAADETNGFLLLEDLGDDSYTRLLAKQAADDLPGKELELYLAATDALVHLHRYNHHITLPDDVPPYDVAALMQEVRLFSDWFLPAVMGGAEATSDLAQEWLAMWKTLLEANTLAENVLVLRDYHADNLLWLPDRHGVKRVGQLDFQDALIGHGAYDLVSLLEDARRDVRVETVEACIAHYLRETGVSAEGFHHAYALLGAQRNAKIIGIFVRLGVRDGKAHYTNYLPRVWQHFHHDLAHPALADVRAWVAKHIKPEWQGAIELNTKEPS